jgi:hypothetical protein
LHAKSSDPPETLLNGAYAAQPSSFVFGHPRVMWNLDMPLQPRTTCDELACKLQVICSGDDMPAAIGHAGTKAILSVTEQLTVNIPGHRA